MAESGITTGTSNTTFDPDGNVTRAQAATFLYRFVDPGEIAPVVQGTDCTREMRLVLENYGLTRAEAECAAPLLIEFEISYLLAVLDRTAPMSDALSVKVWLVGQQCLTYERSVQLIQIFF